MATLKEMEIYEISLVDEGANPEANVMLIKRKGGQPDVMSQVNALINKLNAQIDDYRTDQFTKLARRYEILGQKSEELAPLLKSVNEQNKPIYDKLIAALDKALDVAEQSKLFTTVGKRGGQAQSNDIQKYAAAIRQQNPTFTFRQALDAAYRQHPELQ